MPALTRLALGAAAALTLLAPAPAQAASPMTCFGDDGISFRDATGDSQSDAPGNRDVIAGWFAYDASAGRVTANLQIAQLTLTTGSASTNATYTMFFTARGAPRYVRARQGLSGFSYEYGDGSPDMAPPGGTAIMGGSITAGASGIIEIPLPASFFAAGETLTAPSARTQTTETPVIGAPVTTSNDTAPDTGAGRDFVIRACPAPQPEPQPQPQPEPQPEPQPQPPSNPPAGNPPAQPPVQTTPPQALAPFTVTVPRLRASALKKRGRSFTVTVDPASPTRSLTVTLTRGKLVLAKGTLASLSKATKVKVKASRKIPRGTYKLTISGRNSAGKRVAGAVAVDVAR